MSTPKECPDDEQTIDDIVAAVVAEAPPLADAQRSRIAAALREPW